MKNESGLQGGSGFLRAFRLFQKIAEMAVFVLWLASTVVMLIVGSEWWRSAFEVCSIGLLGISLFNAISMVSFGLFKRERFHTGRFLILLALAVVATIALALSLFVLGIRLQ